MTELSAFRAALETGVLYDKLSPLYGRHTEKQFPRLLGLCDIFAEHFETQQPVELFSAPGRTEVGGNHTDHNRGKSLAASVNMDVAGLAAKTESNVVFVQSARHKMIRVHLGELAAIPEERGHSVALVRGICACFVARGYRIGGFNAATVSDVLSGSGLSSSAAFEVLIGTILNVFYNNGEIDPITIAIIGQEAENRFFGKPCGLLEQTACSVGGFVSMDFADPKNPIVEKIPFHFSTCGHALCIVNTGGSHADLNDEYGAVRSEMEAVAQYFGVSALRGTSKEAVIKNMPALRKQVGDRAVLRALHFFNDNARVDAQAAALRDDDFAAFKQLVIKSGYSSYMFNQNVYLGSTPHLQPISVALALCEELLAGTGAWRVHGGGFAGTVQAYVPNELLDDFKAKTEAVFGAGSCYVLQVRQQGGACVGI